MVYSAAAALIITIGRLLMGTTHFLNNDFFDLTIYQYGHEACEPYHTFGPAVRNHYLIHCILSGKGTFINNYRNQSVTYHLHKGQTFLIEPNTIIHYSADGTDPWEYIWIEFDGLKAREYLKQAGLSQKNPIFQAKTEEGFHMISDYLKYIVEHPHMLPSRTMGYAYLFFSGLIENSATASPLPRNDIKQFYIQAAVAFIENNYMKNITIEDMAVNLNLNRSYFSKIFKKMTQKSPQEFLINYRISKACELMRSTNMTLSEISQHVGYSNQFHFTRAFKNSMNMSPSEWRKINWSN